MEAKDHLLAAYRYLREAEDFPSDPHAAVDHVAHRTSSASDHIDKAREKDPTAKVHTDHGALSADDLTFDALRIQGHMDARHAVYRHEVKRGIVALEKALKYRPDYPGVLLSLGIGHARLENERTANRYYDRVIELEPSNHFAVQLRDGVKGFAEAEHSLNYQFWLGLLKEWRIWATLAGFAWAFYCLYRVYVGLQYGEPDTAYYFWNFVLFVGACIGWNLLKEKIMGEA